MVVGYIVVKELQWGLMGMAWVYTGCFFVMYLRLKGILWKRMGIRLSMHRELLTKEHWKKLFSFPVDKPFKWRRNRGIVDEA